MFKDVFNNITQSNYQAVIIAFVIAVVVISAILSFVKKHAVAAIIAVFSLVVTGSGLVMSVKASSEYIENDINKYITEKTTEAMNNATSAINDISIDSSKINLN